MYVYIYMYMYRDNHAIINPWELHDERIYLTRFGGDWINKNMFFFFFLTTNRGAKFSWLNLTPAGASHDWQSQIGRFFFSMYLTYQPNPSMSDKML